MKSEEPITVREVLEGADIQEFIVNFDNKKIQKLQRGSIKEFLKEVKLIVVEK